ncbi:MAG: hypothetical protein LUD15_07815 [Bacteroides sp.]|nr:hypothetical protein [Bacteroides sp.]
MKNICSAILLLVCLMACTTKTPPIVENPPFIGWSSRSLELAKIERTDSATILYIQAFYRPHNWIAIAKESYLEDNTGKRYPLRSADGIEPGEHFYMPESGETEFKLFFEPVPAPVTSVSFTEGDHIEGAFEIWGINLTGKLPALTLPKEAKTHKINKESDLPESLLQHGTAIITGRIIEYIPEMASEISIWVNNPVEDYPEEYKPEIDEKGNFRLEVPGFSPMHVRAYVMQKSIQFYIVPRETTSVAIVPCEIVRSQSRLHKNDPSTYEAVYFDGYLASLNQELNTSGFSSGSYIDTDRMMEDLYGKNMEEACDYLIATYEKVFHAIDEMEASRGLKRVLKAQVSLELSNAIFNIRSLLNRAYISGHELSGEEARNYYEHHSYSYPENYLQVLNNYPVLFTNDILYTENLNEFLAYTAKGPFQEEFKQLLQENSANELIDLSRLSVVVECMDRFQMISQEELEAFSPFYQSVIRDKQTHIERLWNLLKRAPVLM